MTTEWDNTSWAGAPAPSKALVPYQRAPLKAVTLTQPWDRGPLLSSYLDNPQEKAKRFLQAYKCGWFYKAERKISNDVATLEWSVSDGDVESEDPAETVIPHPDLDIPFEALDPIEQFIRLLERPNPSQTGKALFQKTQIRRDMAGTAFWYLENGDQLLPTAIYGISPARMWDARDKAGNLIGWVMDRDRPSGGVPFSVEEIIAMPMASADDGDVWGVGVVEAVWAELPLTDLMARHTTDLLTTGGRLAGMISPKDRALTEDEFNDAIKTWRSIASDGNAARRLLLFPEPMEYSAGASTPAEIGIPELAALNRDNILTAFPISPYQLGIPAPGGLNSAETRREDRRDYWEGTIHPRVDDLKEIIQVQLISRYERVMGRTFDFDIEEPNLDTAVSLKEKVEALKGLVSVGFDPKEAVKASGLDHIKWVGLPDMLDPAKQLEAQRAAQEAQAQRPVMAPPEPKQLPPGPKGQKARQESRDRVTDAMVAQGRSILTAFLSEQRDRLTAQLRETLPQTKAARKASPDDWWDQQAEDRRLKETMRGIYIEVGRGALQVVADTVDGIIANRQVQAILNDLMAYGGDRITAINEGTRDAVKAQLSEGVRRGYSINQLIDGVPTENYGGLVGAVLDNGTPAFDPYRAEVIARTETMLSYNRSAITAYDGFGVREVQAIDGDGDPDCADRNGQTYAIEEALSIEDHPNGTLDWVPVLDKSVDRDPLEPLTTAIKALGEAAGKQTTIQNFIEPARAPEVHPTFHVDAPVVNVAPAEVKVAATEITVQPPTVNLTVPEAKPPVIHVAPSTAEVTVNVPEGKAPVIKANVTVPAELRITSMPDRLTRRKVERDKKGAIIETTDVETDA